MHAQCCCGRPAAVTVTNKRTGRVEGYLCMDCNLKDEYARALELQGTMALMDMVGQKFNAVAGFEVVPRIRVPNPPPVFNSRAVTNNHINVSNSNGCVVNTGYVHSLSVALRNVSNSTSPEMAQAWLSFSQAVAQSAQITGDQREEISQYLEALSAEISKKPAERKPWVMKNFFGALDAVVTAVPTLVKTWNLLAPHIAAYLT